MEVRPIRQNKVHFFQVAVVSLLLYGCTTWTLIKRTERKLDGSCTRMLRVVLNHSWRQYHTKQHLYGHLPAILKTIQIRRARHAGHCWTSKGALISDVLLWTRSYGRARVVWPIRTYQQLCTDTGCSMEELTKAMDDRDEWQERVREICASGTLWYIYIYILLYKARA